MQAAARQLSNVSFVPRVPVGDIGPVLARADALLVHLKDDPLFQNHDPVEDASLHGGRPPHSDGCRAETPKRWFDKRTAESSAIRKTPANSLTRWRHSLR